MTPTTNDVEPTTSATEELRRLLDERGADYRVSATGYSIDIGPYTTAYANRSNTTLDVSLRQVTPEQAIEATLGRETCTLEKICDGYLYFKVHECNECGTRFAYRAIRSDKNARPNYCPNCGREVVGE